MNESINNSVRTLDYFAQTVTQALHQLRLHLFAPGYNVFLVARFNAVPFLLFAIFAEHDAEANALFATVEGSLSDRLLDRLPALRYKGG